MPYLMAKNTFNIDKVGEIFEMKKERLKAVMAMALIIPAISMPAKVTADINNSFKDIYSNDWFYSSVLRLNSLKAISGFPDNTFRPHSYTTKAEFVKILLDAFKVPVEKGHTFSDTKDHWSSNYVSSAIANGIIFQNTYNGGFQPDGFITRIEMSTMILSMLNVQYIEGESPFDDISNKVSNTAFHESLIIGSIKNGKRYFNPHSSVTRAEASAAIVRAIDYMENPEAYKRNYKKEIEQQEKLIKKQIQEIRTQELYNTLVKPSSVIAEITENTKLFSSYYTSSGVIGTVNKGTNVEIIYGMFTEWFYISYGNVKGWVQRNALSIPPDPPTNVNKMTREQLEGFVNYKGFMSSSAYLVWVDIDRQLTYVFSGSKGNWKLNKTIQCSTGKNESPTIRGTFTVSRRGDWFYNSRYKSGAKYWVEFSGDYLFHSISLDAYGKIKDPTLGVRASSGCVRMSIEDSKWIYNNIPKGTTVWVN